MYSSDYTKELSIQRTEKGLPTVLVIVLFALLGGALWFGYLQLKPHPPQEQPVAQIK